MNKRKLLNLALSGTIALSSLMGFASSSSASSFGEDIADRADNYIGYKITDFNSADFVSYVFEREGMKVPSNLSDLSEQGKLIANKNDLQTGDVVFLGTSRTNLIAAGIYTGDGEFVVAYKPYNRIREIDLQSDEVKRYFLGAKRIIKDTQKSTQRQISPKESSALGKSMIQLGERFLGVKYKLGAEYETSGRFDCSSFTQYVYKKHGIQIPRGARGQFLDGQRIARKDLRVGDLVFFSTTLTTKYDRDSIKRIGHVGIYAGNNKVLHTYGEGGVKYSDMSKGWWDKHYVAAARYTK